MGIGIMQGRLNPPEDGRFQSFPRQGWREEFPRAAAAGLTAIEWIWDAYGFDVNPLRTETGLAEMRALSREHGIAVRSICADYFMDYPLVRVDGAALAERRSALDWLIGVAGGFGIERIVVPFVDASRVDPPSDKKQVIDVLTGALRAAKASKVELHLEMDLKPADFADLLEELPYPEIRANYDSGNSSSLGYHPTEEFAAYGNRVGSVHIKDRILKAATVPLGTGDADFAALAAALRQVAYSGDFILQAARGVAGDEVTWTKQNRLFAEAHGLVGAR
jgi:L-ribulose-5-phosphate 3-epimerase